VGGEGLTGSPILKVAVTFLACLALSYVLLQSVFLSILTPLPQIYCYVRLGRFAGLTLPAVLFVFLWNLSSGFGLSYLLQFGITGAVVSECILRKLSIDKSFALTVATVVIITFSVLSALALRDGISADVMIMQLTQRVVEESISLYEQVEAPREQIEQFKKSSAKIVDTVPKVFPAILVVAVLITLWLNILALTGYFNRKGIESPFGILSTWKAPDYFVWGLIVSGISVFAASGLLRTVGINMFLVLCVIYFFQGMAIISFFFKKKGLSPLLRTIGYLIIVWYLSVVVAVIGLFDLWADFRKISSPLKKRM